MEEYLEIKNQVINNYINYKVAIERIRKLPKPWHTKHWKEMREKHLKDKCENCGSTEPPLVIQHTKHPKEFSTLYKQIMAKYIDYENVKVEVIEKHVTEKNVESFLKENLIIRGSCPECGTINIRKNNKKDIYICVKQHSFETPVDVLYYTKSRTTDMEQAKDSAINHLSYIKISEEIKKLRESYDLQVGKEALLLSFEEGIEYRLFKNIKTCCKRCAAIEDEIIPRFKLCEKCKINLHNPIYKTCYHCWNGLSKID